MDGGNFCFFGVSSDSEDGFVFVVVFLFLSLLSLLSLSSFFLLLSSLSFLSLSSKLSSSLIIFESFSVVAVAKLGGEGEEGGGE